MGHKTILITGASSGIGAALALVEARPGVTLMLWARDEKRLAGVAAACQARGADVQTEIFDLREIGGLAAKLAAADAAIPIDLAIFNAGLGGTASDKNAAELPDSARDNARSARTQAEVSACTSGESRAIRSARSDRHSIASAP